MSSDSYSDRLQIGDIVRPSNKRFKSFNPNLLGVVSFVMSESGVVSNPYSVEWEDWIRI